MSGATDLDGIDQARTERLRIPTSRGSMLRDLLLPLAQDEAVSQGWTAITGFRPAGVTWHWTAVPTLAETRALLGPGGARRGEASAHLAVGRDATEGIDRYVTLAHRSWHCGRGQTLDWRGRPSTEDTKGARTTVGIECVHVGFAREGVRDGPGWLDAAAPDGTPLRVAPWPAAQVELLVEVARHVRARCPWIRPENHHGHLDLCPATNVDPLGLPFAEVLRRAYDDPGLPDVWTPFLTLDGRRRALRDRGYRVGEGLWGTRDDAALRTLQGERGLVVDGLWTLWVSRVLSEA